VKDVMNIHICVLIVSLFSLAGPLAGVVQAQDLSPAQEQAFTDYFSQYVHVVTKPFYIYSWQSQASQYSSVTQVSDPAGLRYVQDATSLFWQNFGKHDPNGNAYGPGFYAAADLLQTARSFGKSDPTLFQVQMSVGLRLLDFNNDKKAFLADPKTPEIQAMLKKLRCLDYGGDITRLLFSGGVTMKNSCRTLLTSVVRDKLKIDAFAYFYPEADETVNHCSESHNVAFILTNESAVQPAHVKMFTRFTQDAQEDRIRIQSEFNVLQPETKADVLESGVISKQFSMSTEQEMIKPSATMKQTKYEPSNLFWDELNGKPVEANIDQWNRENLYGCGDQLPTVSLKEYEATQAAASGTSRKPAKVEEIKKAHDQTSK